MHSHTSRSGHRQPTWRFSKKIRELVNHWEQGPKGRLTRESYAIHLDLDSAARMAALAEMYPRRSPEELMGELIAAALEELETSLPYVKGQKVIATDEQGDPLYEDVGPTQRFLSLARKHLHQLQDSADAQTH